jgi:hypothetical protein
MSENTPEFFNRLIWHDSKLLSFRIIRKNDVDEVVLEVELRGISENELTAMTVTLEDAVFFLSDIDLQGKRECADDISSARCETKTDLMAKLQNGRLKYSPEALAGYFHFSIYLIPPGGNLDIVAGGFRLAAQKSTS